MVRPVLFSFYLSKPVREAAKNSLSLSCQGSAQQEVGFRLVVILCLGVPKGAVVAVFRV